MFSHLSLEAAIEAIRKEIAYPHDGPVTEFVLMSRACEVAARGANPEACANALHEELTARGFLRNGWVEPSGERA
jgi:hypothetical protein